MRKAVRVVTGLVIAFDTARRAWELQTPPGWDAAADELRRALADARSLGDVVDLPVSLSWWASAQQQAKCWLEASPDVRRGLTPAVTGTMTALQRWAANNIAEGEAPHGVGVR